jgi:plasmid stability protein
MEAIWNQRMQPEDTMANLTLKQVPNELYQRLKERAAAHRRSINNEAIMCLEQILEPRKLEVESWLEEARALRRQAPNVFLTDAALREAKEEGRP